MTGQPYYKPGHTINDVSDISELSKQLGYPNSASDIRDRLNCIMNSDDHKVYVAHMPKGKTIAWIHLFASQRIESGPIAEIGGFVVSELFRNKGIAIKCNQQISDSI